MIVAFESLLPSFLLIALGFTLARTSLFEPVQWDGVERLNYYALFPLLLLMTMLRADLGSAPIAPMAAAMVLAILIVSGAMLLTRPLWLKASGAGGAAFSSHFQGAIRWQSPVALAVCSELYGNDGLALAAIGVAAMIPLLNVLCVAVITGNSGRTSPTALGLLREIARNPLILATVAGAALNPLGQHIYEPVLETLDLLGRGALGIGLLLVGVGLAPMMLKPRLDLLAVLAVKLLVMPALMVGLAIAFGLSGIALSVVAICGAVPTASSSYVLARRLGGDAPLMAAIVTAGTIASFLTLPVAVWLAGAIAASQA